jgi:hypothetical protein
LALGIHWGIPHTAGGDRPAAFHEGNTGNEHTDAERRERTAGTSRAQEHDRAEER